MKYKVLGVPRIESEYCDEWETVMVVDLEREDGEIGDVWIVAGVPEHQRGSSEAARTQFGYQEVDVFGDSIDMWCPNSFQVLNETGDYSDVSFDVIAAVTDAALTAHRMRLQEA